ncbi:hypothetical protein ACQKPE_15600 [Pseudomonas sp. NPDC089554]|uniref:hypothetical protein n=1 Tax=Pseudomonas sp. NPDC089554 TaxID=3390653 RepID=UPI003D0118E6
MNLSKYLLLAILALGSSTALAEGGAERSQQFWAAFREDQQRLHGDRQKAVAESTRQQPHEKARQVAKD